MHNPLILDPGNGVSLKFDAAKAKGFSCLSVKSGVVIISGDLPCGLKAQNDAVVRVSGSVHGNALAYDLAQVNIGSVQLNAESHDKSHLNAGTVMGDAFAHDMSSLTVSLVKGNAYSFGESKLSANVVEKTAECSQQSVMRIQSALKAVSNGGTLYVKEAGVILDISSPPLSSSKKRKII